MLKVEPGHRDRVSRREAPGGGGKGGSSEPTVDTGEVPHVSHPKHAPIGLLDRRIEGSRDTHCQHIAGLGGVDDTVIP